MAIDNSEDTNGAEDPATLLKSLEKKSLANKYLFIAVLCFTGIVFAVMATGMTVMYFKLSDLDKAAQELESDQYDEQFLALEQQLLLLADFRKSELKKIEAYTRQLNIISTDCNVEKAAPYRDFLTGREQDFQRFIDTLKSGTNSLANMNKGSRDWLDSYNTELDALKQSSSVRQVSLEKLMTNSSMSKGK